MNSISSEKVMSFDLYYINLLFCHTDAYKLILHFVSDSIWQVVSANLAI